MSTILVLTNNIDGLHCFRKEVMKALVDEGFEVIISYPDQSEKAEYFSSIGCQLVFTPFNRRGMNPVADMKLMLSYRRLIKKFKPSVVLTYTIKPNIYGGMACRLCGVPYMANVTGLGDSLENGGMLAKLAKTLYHIGLKKAYRVFFQNKSNMATGKKMGLISGPITLLPGSGVSLEHHVYQSYPQEDTIKFLFIGRLLRDKGVGELFEAAKRIKSTCPNTEFHILGPCEGNFKDQLDELEKAGIIIYHGPSNDVRPFIGNVHCTIMPSYHEGMSNVNLESAANGRPVITTDVPGCQETVDDGVTGFLCQAKSTDSLTEALEKFLSLSPEEKEKMGQAGRQKVEREFSRDIVVKEYVENCKKITNK